MRITKVLNNNVAMVDQDGVELIVMGLGIAFKKGAGDTIKSEVVERTFEASGGRTIDQLASLLRDIPVDVIAVADEIITIGKEKLGMHVDQRLLVPLADHLDSAIQRQSQNLQITYPLAFEVAHLYPDETAIGHEALALITARLGVALPPVEAVPLALHFVNAQFNAVDGIAQIVAMTETFKAILDVIRYEYMAPIDEQSLDVVRFTTHLRYLFLRRRDGDVGQNELAGLSESVRTGDPKAYGAAGKVARLLEKALDWSVSNDEILYLALHIHRLTRSNAA